MKLPQYALVLLGIAAFGAAGCSQQTIDSANKDANHDIAVVGQQAKKVAAEAKPEMKKLDLGARVTAALQANQNLPSTIRVDASTNGVRLRGTVNTAQQKALAGQVAKDTLGPGKTVSNELTVKGNG